MTKCCVCLECGLSDSEVLTKYHELEAAMYEKKQKEKTRQELFIRWCDYHRERGLILTNLGSDVLTGILDGTITDEPQEWYNNISKRYQEKTRS